MKTFDIHAKLEPGTYYLDQLGDLYRQHWKPAIEKVIFNPPATIVIWKNGMKTVSKVSKNDNYDPEKGLMLCLLKGVTLNNRAYQEFIRPAIIKDWIDKDIYYYDNGGLLHKERGEEYLHEYY